MIQNHKVRVLGRRMAQSVLSTTIAGAGAVSIAWAQAEPVAVAEGEWSGVRIEVTELQRASGGTLTLKFRMINDSGETINPRNIFDSADVGKTYLLDFAGRKKYLPVRANGTCVCSAPIPGSLEPGQSVTLWARFPAPPAATTDVSVVFPKFLPADAKVGE